ncbi:MAG: CHASE3 domain-containing protein, partial [Actinomycetota bacterium]|nr:CHASE3 domain-containing protein [Actinomycetota bacterium]
MSLRARIAALLGAFAVVLVGCGALVYAALEAADERDKELTQRLTPASQVARDLLADFFEQETGVRGYVITGDRDFLDSFDRGRRRADEAVARLRSLVGGDPGISQELEEVLEAQDSWRRFAAGPEIAARRRGDVERARELVITRQGRTRFVRLRGEVAELQELVEADRAEAVEQAAQADRRLGSAVALAGGA